MKTFFNYILMTTLLLSVLSCTENEGHNNEIPSSHHSDKVHLSAKQFKNFNIQLGELDTHHFNGSIKVNGTVEIPPQNEATITAIIGGNITSINKIEGQEVKKGEIIAYLSHPEFITIQTAYMKAHHKDAYLSKEFERQQNLSKAEIGSGKELQRIESEYLTNQQDILGYEAQLKQLGLNLNAIRSGQLYERIPVTSPIGGTIENININIGQYVDAQTPLFTIINTDELFVDFLVFEKDIIPIKKEQVVEVSHSSSPHLIQAEIIAVGKRFEEKNRAAHVHAKITSDSVELIAGMFVNGTILTETRELPALPETAIITENNKKYIFTTTLNNNSKEEYEFDLIEIKTGLTNEDWVEVILLDKLPSNTKVVIDGAYYLISEMMKEELEHDH